MRNPSAGTGNSGIFGRLCRADGFTLLELLIAMSLLAVIAAIIAGALQLSASTWEKGSKRVERYQRAQSVIERIASDLRSARPEVFTNPATRAQVVAFDGLPDSVRFISGAEWVSPPAYPEDTSNDKKAADTKSDTSIEPNIGGQFRPGGLREVSFLLGDEMESGDGARGLYYLETEANPATIFRAQSFFPAANFQPMQYAEPFLLDPYVSDIKFRYLRYESVAGKPPRLVWSDSMDFVAQSIRSAQTGAVEPPPADGQPVPLKTLPRAVEVTVTFTYPGSETSAPDEKTGEKVVIGPVTLPLLSMRVIKQPPQPAQDFSPENNYD